MRRIAVIGCGGSGKTTLANRLGAALGLPVIHSDFYRPGWEEAHQSLIEREAWVIDAMRLGTLTERLARADTVVFIDRMRLHVSGESSGAGFGTGVECMRTVLPTS